MMRIASLRRSRGAAPAGIVGVARVDRRTKSLAKRLRPGDVAVIDHVDLDRASADMLAACGVGAVVNASPSTSGRYPNLGPKILADAGILLVDHVGGDVFGAVKDGQRVQIVDGVVSVKGEGAARGEVLDAPRVDRLMEDARAGMSTQLESFTANAMEYLRRERDLLLDGAGLPGITTRLEGRHALIVVKEYDYSTDLRQLRRYIGEYGPVLIGVEGGADALLEAGHQPDLIVGDLEDVSNKALRSGAELVVHAGHVGRPTGMDRLERLGIDGIPFHTTGTAEDAAMLFAEHNNASLIVTIGTNATLVALLDKGRSGMASTFLTRLQAGSKLVDAKAVTRLYRSQVRSWHLLLLLLSGIVALIVAVALTSTGQEWLDDLGRYWADLLNWVQGLLS